MNRSLLSLLALCLLFPLSACSNSNNSNELYDFDDDGSLDTEDCAPVDPTIYPGADDPYGDDLDTNCDGGDGIDSDADGYPANEDLALEDEARFDCDDTRGNIHPGANDNVGDQLDSNCDGHDGTDNDRDGYASLNSEGDDCDDTSEDIHPGADDSYDDAVDSNCDGGDGIDNDGDGYPANEELLGSEFYDCNDANAAVHPGAEEVPDDGIDNDCDGAELVDEDGDGHYEGFDDCDDADPHTYLGAPELPDGLDNDCDTLLDEDTDLADDDGDGYCEGWDIDDDGSLDCSGLAEPGDCDDDNTMLTPADLDGDLVSSCNGDCDDANAQRSSTLPEVCDGLDNDCDLALPLNEQDIDSDGYMPCTGDCADLVATTYLGATESCNAVDDDCDGSTDEDFDSDGDGVTSCGEDGLLGTADDDCDDSNAAVSPELTEACDGLDNDCDLLVPSNEDDLDLDGFMVCEADCNDANLLLTPADLDGDGASSCDGDCDDGDLDLNLLDGDGDGSTSCDGDCDDSDAANYPANTEVCDGQDNDCDAATSAAGGEGDADGDSDPSCSDCDDNDPVFHSFDLDADTYSPCGADELPGTPDDDCDDSDYWMNPSVTDIVGDGVDQNCDELDGIDQDGDGWASNAPEEQRDCNDTDAAWNPGAADWVDPQGDDTNCDGLDGVDADGDLFASYGSGGLDCNDTAGDPVAAITWPGAPDPTGDNNDTDCDGLDGVDNDGDLWASEASGGDDCNDLDEFWYPGADDLVDPQGDDTNCDGLDGVDADGDLFASEESGGLDCNDTAGTPIAAVTFPGASDGWGDLVDTNCDGVDGVDNDGDGYAVLAGFDQDCNDSDPTAFPGNPDWDFSDGIDTDCDGHVGVMSPPSAELSFEGEDGYDWSGWSVTSVGDVDNDELDDILVGANGNDEGGYAAGKSYLFLGSSVATAFGMGTTTLNVTSADVVFVGDSVPSSGFVVAGAGDVDGDDFDDILIGAQGSVTDDYPGMTYLFLGKTVNLGIDGGTSSWDLSQADAFFESSGNEVQDGSSVASAGDIDGDGLSDILIGAPDHDLDGAMTVPPGPIWDVGLTYLFLGSTILAAVSPTPSSAPTFGSDSGQIPPDYSILGEAEYSYSGCSVASAGDVDADGYDDILIGAKGHDEGGQGAGKTYLFLGNSLLTVAGEISIGTADTYFLGEAAGDESGISVASAGDVDDDGYDDILIGAPGNDEGGSDSGQSYLFFGSTVGAGGPFDLSLADASFVGENAFDYSGESVSAAGDIDGDGLGDIVIGAWGNDQAGDLSGKTYVFLGSTLVASTSAQIELSSADTSFIGAAGDTSGWSVASGGDVDADGFDDLIIGGPYNDAGGTNAGTTYLLLGPGPP